MMPVSTEDEDFSFTVGEEALKSKFVFDDGEYPAICTNFEKGLTQPDATGKRNDKYVLSFTGSDGPVAGKDFKLHLSLSPKAQWKILEVMAAFGIEMDPETRNLPISKAKIVNQPVTLVLKAEKKDSGKTFMEIQTVLAPKAATASSGGLSF
jgi:hypothetical protein